MRIVHIITRLILGGAQQNTVLCCRAQVQAGHEVFLLYGPIYGPEGSLETAARATGAELIEIRALRRAVLPVHDWLCYRVLRRLLRHVQPDIVHTHSSKAGIVGRAAAWKEHVPGVVHTIHGLPFHPRNSALVNRLYVGLERYAAKRCHRLIGVTQAMEAEFLARGIGRPGQFVTIPSGMDVAEFDVPPETRQRVRRELGIPDEAPVVGIIARLDKLKGQEDLLDILADLRARFPAVRLLMVGEGWDGDNLRARVAREGWQKQVIFTGLLPPERIPGVVAAMDVHALPSYQEGQPRTMVQALLGGVPVVGYDAGGIKDVCLDGQTGRLVPLGYRPGLAQAILGLLGDADLRRKLGEQGRAFARTHYDSSIMTHQLEEVYRQVLEEHRSGPRGPDGWPART